MNTRYLIMVGVQWACTMDHTAAPNAQPEAFSMYSRDAMRWEHFEDALQQATQTARELSGHEVKVYESDTMTRVASLTIGSRG